MVGPTRPSTLTTGCRQDWLQVAPFHRLVVPSTTFTLTFEQAVQACCEALGCPPQKGRLAGAGHSSLQLSLQVWLEWHCWYCWKGLLGLCSAPREAQLRRWFAWTGKFLGYQNQTEPWLLNVFTGCRRANGDGATGEQNLPGEDILF